MAAGKFREQIGELLLLADVHINGDRPWDIQVHTERLFPRVMAEGSLGLGESYMEGWWDCEQLDELFFRMLRGRVDEKINPWKDLAKIAQAKVINRQSRSRAYQVGTQHYDVGNDLYDRMLDQRMIYSCGYWKDAASLDEAQEAKLDLICRKLDLQPGMRLLDVGCGWGGTAKYAAERHGVAVVGVTISREQARLAQEICRGLPIEIRLQDYRSLDEKFDRVVSVGMFEHVGYKNYSTFMRVARRNLDSGGLFLLHTIGGSRSVCCTDRWIDRYIFPNAMLPSAKQICSACEDIFLVEDWHNFGADYDRTLMQWFANFDAGWPEIANVYGNRFYRMWKYYLLSCAGTFRARRNHVWQILLSPRGVPGGYLAPR